jgi:hypothetical protein
MKAPDGWRVLDFYKFSGDDSRSSMEHISTFLVQMGEVSTLDFMNGCYFPLSFTGTAFVWFTSLQHCSIGLWSQLEEKFHAHFYNGVHETRLSHLTSVRQGRDESILDSIKRFRDTKNRCFHLMISERDLPDLCFASLHSCIREKLEHYEFLNVNQLLQKAVAIQSRLKESRDVHRSHRSTMHVVESYSNNSNNENKESYAAEFVWPVQNKLVICPSLKPIHKNWNEEIKFTFDFSKCD